MAIAEQFKMLIEGRISLWNKWREENNKVTIDLYGVDLNHKDLSDANFHGVNLGSADFSGANLCNADFSFAKLTSAKFSRAKLNKAKFTGAWLYNADFKEASLSEADLRESVLYEANFKGAVLKKALLMSAVCLRTDFSYTDLSDAYLPCANFVETNLEEAVLSNCNIYGLSVWNLIGNPKEQKNLIITPPWNPDEAIITVDDLQVAQFIYLLLNNRNVRNVIDTITSKAVLILGRFTADRKVVLEGIKEELRKRNYLPILFDFEASEKRDINETVTTLAHMSRFIIADITDAKSIPQELVSIVPFLPSVPVQPILLASQSEYGMFEHFKRYPWVLEAYKYLDMSELIGSISEKIIDPLEAKFSEQTIKRI